MPDKATLYDVVIIGGGPAGLSAALVLARANRRVIVVDAGQPRNKSAQTLHNFLGLDGCSPHELLAAGRRDVARYDVEIIAGEAVNLQSTGANDRTQFSIKLANERVIAARKVLFATGMRDDLPDWPGFADCYGISVHHCPYCDAYEYRGRTIVAFGRQARAARGIAQSLLTWTPRVVILSEETDCPSPPLKLPCHHGRIRRLQHQSGVLSHIELENGTTIECAAMFFNTSQSPTCDLPKAMGCESVMDDQQPTNRKQQTNVPGIYLAGDADGDVKFAIVAAAEGAKAAVAINRELQDESLEARDS